MIVRRIREAADSRREQAFDLLRSLVEVNSFSGNPEGLNRVGEIILKSLPKALQTSYKPDGNGARHHIVTSVGRKRDRTLLIGHLDTVFPSGDNSNPYRREGKRIRGQGAADMKGGIVVMIQSFRILEALGFLHRIPLIGIFNADEEVGSPFSEKIIRETAESVSRGLVFEAGGSDGEIVTARRGAARFELTVKGWAGHAGDMKEPKASAVADLARKVIKLEALNDWDRGISLNVGTVTGGRATNVIPGHAVAGFEYRFWNEEDEREIQGKVEEIIGRPEIPGCDASFRKLNRRPGMVPVPGYEELVRLVAESATALGQEVGTERRGGGSDGNFLSEMGVPVIDGLGPVGGKDHSAEEYILEQSLYERIELTTLVLCRLAGID